MEIDKDIYLTDLETGDRIRFPMLPEEIIVQTENIFQNYSKFARLFATKHTYRATRKKL